MSKPRQPDPSKPDPSKPDPSKPDPSKVEVTDPLAGPWTVRRNRKRGRRRLEKSSPLSGGLGVGRPTGGYAEIGPLGARGRAATATMAAVDLDTTTGRSSYLDARPPHMTRRPRTRADWLTWLPRLPRLLRPTRRTRRGRRLRRWVAVLMLALLVTAGLALTSVIVGLVKGGRGWTSGQAAAASPLVVPAPTSAGGLPLRVSPMHNPIARQLIAEFTQKFASAVGSYSGAPAGLYREPGTIDPISGQPGWVIYLGDNVTASLGAPGVTITRVMTALTGTSAPDSSWPVAPGPRGGSAECAITNYDSTTVSLCAWATENTIGALMSPLADTRGNELAALMPVMRLDLQPGWPSRRLRP